MSYGANRERHSEENSTVRRYRADSNKRQTVTKRRAYFMAVIDGVARACYKET